MLPKAPEQDNADYCDHNLNSRENTVEIDAFVKAAFRNQPGMRSSVGKVEVNHEECSANRGGGGEKANGFPYPVRNAIPTAEPDEGTSEKGYPS